MKSIFVSLIAVFLPVFLIAGTLAPGEKASLFQHLKEVNPHIEFFAEESGILATELSFENDQERIKAHLAFVELVLRQKSPEGLSAEAILNRKNALADLNTYWKNGSFPINSGHPSRQPYFIDQNGVACAVGQLMVESGEVELAETIRSEQNFGFIRSLKENYPEIKDWASANGFSENELAWIQPAYPPQQDWEAMGYGTNGSVNLVFPDPSGKKIVIAGNFTEADSQSHNMVTIWNGNNYQSLGGGLSGTINDGLVYKGAIWFFGQFNKPGGGFATVARYEGNNWSYADPFPGMSAVITTANVFGDSIVFAGSYDAFGQVDYLASFKNESYRQLAIINKTRWKIDGPIEDVEWFDGNFYVCGDIKDNIDPHHPQVPVLALGSNGFYQAGTNAMDLPVFDMEVYDGEILAGGEFFDAQDQPGMGLAAFDGSNWKGLIDVSMHASPSDSTSGAIYNIFINDDLVVLAGEIQTAPIIIGNYGSYLLGYQRTNDTTAILSGLANLDAAARTVCELDGDYYTGGDFQFAGFFSARVNHVAYWKNPTSAISNPKEVLTLASYPNPASSETFIAFEQASEAIDVTLFNLNGQAVKVDVEVLSDGYSINRDQLNDGLYIYQLTGEQGLIATGKVWFY